MLAMLQYMEGVNDEKPNTINHIHNTKDIFGFRNSVHYSLVL